MVSFSQLPVVKKDTIFGAARKIFGTSYFVTALAPSCICVFCISVIQSIEFQKQEPTLSLLSSTLVYSKQGHLTS